MPQREKPFRMFRRRQGRCKRKVSPPEKEIVVLYVAASVCIAIMICSAFLLFLGLPGTWLILGLGGLWAFFVESPAMTFNFFMILVALAALGEGADFCASYFGAKKFGGSTRGSLGGMIGAITGAILCAPILFGLGALPGALLGAFAGCFIVEHLRGTKGPAAVRAAWGTALGYFGGFLIKLGVAVIILMRLVPAIWQSAA